MLTTNSDEEENVGIYLGQMIKTDFLLFSIVSENLLCWSRLQRSLVWEVQRMDIQRGICVVTSTIDQCSVR